MNLVFKSTTFLKTFGNKMNYVFWKQYGFQFIIVRKSNQKHNTLKGTDISVYLIHIPWRYSSKCSLDSLCKIVNNL